MVMACAVIRFDIFLLVPRACGFALGARIPANARTHDTATDQMRGEAEAGTVKSSSSLVSPRVDTCPTTCASCSHRACHTCTRRHHILPDHNQSFQNKTNPRSSVPRD